MRMGRNRDHNVFLTFTGLLVLASCIASEQMMHPLGDMMVASLRVSYLSDRHRRVLNTWPENMRQLSGFASQNDTLKSIYDSISTGYEFTFKHISADSMEVYGHFSDSWHGEPRWTFVVTPPVIDILARGDTVHKQDFPLRILEDSARNEK
jgi:hypothetical protein